MHTGEFYEKDESNFLRPADSNRTRKNEGRFRLGVRREICYSGGSEALAQGCPISLKAAKARLDRTTMVFWATSNPSHSMVLL